MARPLLYVGVLAIVAGIAKAHATWVGHYDLTGSARFAWTALFAGIMCVTAYGFGLPDVPRTRAAAVGGSVGAAFTGAVAMSIVQLFVGDALLPRSVVFGSALLLPDWYRLCIRLSAGGRLRAEARARVVVVGRPDEVAALELELQGQPERPAAVIGHLTPEAAAVQPDGTRPLQLLLDQLHPTVLVLDLAAQQHDGVVAQAGVLHERGVRIRTLSAFYEDWLGKLPLSELERASLFFDIGELHRAGYGRAKRVLDVPVALGGMVALAMVAPLVWVANLGGNRGPLLYRQIRVGKGGGTFTLLKFRTMTPSGPVGGVGNWTTEDDPRITPVGRVLRKTHLDELPQMVNILRGDLGVVGPRPEQPHYVDELTDKLPFYGLRHVVRPGLTGWAQVKYGYAGNESDALEKLQYEFWYLRHQSLRTDAKIVGRTVRSVLGSEGTGR
ncbi:MAG: sugar transferase [Acidimicrobiales bacterium]|nr:sugar transferase [Acidimicrobiales bacterium]